MDDGGEKLSMALEGLMSKFGNDWRAFNEVVAGFPIPASPELLSPERHEFRTKFIAEESNELGRAYASRDMDGVVDAAIDLIYVTVGMLGEMGVLTQPVWDEVQRANMRKRRGSLSKRPGGGFDAVKPEGWVGPSHADYLTVTSEEVETIMALRSGKAKLVLPPSSSKKLKLVIIGHARHGKDTVCELLREHYGLKFTSSSQFCASRVVMPKLSHLWQAFNRQWPIETPRPTIGPYLSVQECFEDRMNHRKFWFDAIVEYNTPDLSRLGREILEANDMYCGLRNADELKALKATGLVDAVVWVDASRRVPPEAPDSCTVTPDMADHVLHNNGDLADLKVSLMQLMRSIKRTV